MAEKSVGLHLTLKPDSGNAGVGKLYGIIKLTETGGLFFVGVPLACPYVL